MTSASLNAVLDRLEDEGTVTDDDALYEAFATWAQESGRPLYPHQEEALVELISGAHVIAQTPTGSGKSLIALAGHFLSLARGGRSYYTAPLKALVSEKFFDLVDAFGAHNVGMVTGDVALNADAPIICCTAEILANQSLREGANLDADMVIMDEFHFYGDPQRGWAWQVPLLELNQPQFVFLSATLGDTTTIEEEVEERTGRQTAVIADAQRPVPLEFEYLIDPLDTVIERLIREGKAPIYVVHFTQKDAVATASALARVVEVSPEKRKQIQEVLRGQEMGRGFGKTLRELLLKGIAVHHAGMLPRYRRLVERLAQKGLLQVICGTDTLGVGINVPIRTVLFTSLVKYDGRRSRHLSAREFHQIAGRAGRPGFDEVGFVKATGSPEEVEALARKARMSAAQEAGDRKKQKKLAKKGGGTRKQGELSWTRATFDRLTNAQPEALHPRFHTSHAAFLNVLEGPGDPEQRLLRLAREATDSRVADAKAPESNRFLREFGDIYRSLLQAGLIERVAIDEREKRQEHGKKAGTSDGTKEVPTIRVVGDIPDDFALNQPLAPFALAALDLLDPTSPTYVMDIVSVIEAVMEDPRPLLYAQQRAARDRAFHAMREEGLDYEQRREALAEITWPTPLAEVLLPAFDVFAHSNPWVKGYEPSPKRVVREMVEEGLTFSVLVSRYDLNNAEGVILRYLSDTYKALRQVLPVHFQTEEVEQIIEWLRQLLASVDSSLLTEWEHMMAARLQGAAGVDTPVMGRPREGGAEGAESAFGTDEEGRVSFRVNRHALHTAIRTAAFERVELLAKDDCAGLARREVEAGSHAWPQTRWEETLDAYWDEWEWMRIDQVARSSELFVLNETPDELDLMDACGISDAADLPLTSAGDHHWWIARQVIADPEDTGEWRLTTLVDVPATLAANRVVMRTASFGVG